MGTTYSVKWVDSTVDHSEAVRDLVEKRLAQVNSAMSTYDPTSQISTFNKTDVNVKYKVSKDFFNTLTIAQGISEHTAGAFDVTVAPLINIWGFGHNGQVTKQPTEADILAAKELTGYQKLELLPNKSLIKKTAPITINLSAVAKGYGVDAVATLLEQYKIHNYFVEIGGEVYARGLKPDLSPWKVGIEKPVATNLTNNRQIQEVLNVSDVGLATSGDYRNYFEENGVRYSHTIDPVTGKPITHKLASVSVLRQTTAEADAYATALMVMGDKKGVEFAQKNRIDALFVIKSPHTETGFKEVMTGSFADHVIKPVDNASNQSSTSKTELKPAA